MADFNRQIIEEFRANGGEVGGPFAGAPLLLLHTVGAKSGAERVNPLMYLPLDADGAPGPQAPDGPNGPWAVFASYAGADRNPAWYHNLLAHPDATIELGDGAVAVRARVTEGEERTRIWEAQKRIAPGFAQYESKTTREIPVVILERA